jgi:L1 cell adhesion molecule like protein
MFGWYKDKYDCYSILDMEKSDICIGIDLGTTFSCVGVYRNGRVDIIPNDQGNRTTASYVAFTDTERLIGDGAKIQAPSNPLNTIYDVKRLIGRKFSDSSVQSDLKYFTFKVINDGHDRPKIMVTIKGEECGFYPEEISGMLLGRLKEYAEAYLGEKIKYAVITVPAYFNDSQRQATKDAGTIAGLDVIRIINEPTSASIAYGLDKKSDSKILIFDYGGGTLDVSVLEISEGVFEVKSTSGNTHLGGEDLDNKLVIHCIKEFSRKNKLSNEKVEEVMKSPRVIRRLRTICENAKKSLSSSMQTNITVDTLYDGLDLDVIITRAKFEEFCFDEFKKCFIPVDKALSDAKLDKHSIDEIILVGGSTRILKIREMIKNYFGKEPKNEVNPDEAVAYGAAVQGFILKGNGDEKTSSIVLLDVTPLSLGVEVAGKLMSKIIERNHSIPCSKEQIFTTYSDNQTAVKIDVYEGEREFTKDNNLLGSLELSGIPPMMRGQPKINIKFELNADGILSVSATEESTKISKKVAIKNEKGRLSKSQIESMVNDAERFAEEDKKLRDKIDAKNEFENYLYGVKNSLTDELKAKIGDEKCKKLTDIIVENLKWIEESADSSTTEQIKEKKQEIEKEIIPILQDAYKYANTEEPKESSKKPHVEEVD